MTGPVRSVSQAFAILRLLSSRSDGLTLSQVGRELGLSPSSCLNLLRTLVAEGMIARAEDQRYRVTAAWGDLDSSGRLTERLIARATGPMRELAERAEATVGLWQAVSADRLGLIALSESGAATRIHMVVGQRQPIGGGATGRALAASEGLSQTELQRRFAAVRWQSPLTFEEYLREVAEAAAQGYAIDDGSGHAGIASLGCRIPLPGRSRFCLSASVFANSHDRAALERLGQALVATAAEISALLT